MAEKVLMTALSPTMEEGIIQSWTRNEGDQIVSGDIICEVETDKASMEYESNQEGTLLKILVPAGKAAKVGESIAIIGKEGEDISSLLTSIQEADPPTAAPPAQPAPAPATPLPVQQAVAPASPTSRGEKAQSGRIKASPLARRLAGLKHIDLALIQGSGPGGRIVKRDVENYVPAAQFAGVDTVVPLSNVRGVIAKRLSESKFTAPHYYLKLSVNMASIIAARAMLNSKRDKKVGMNAFFIKFAAEALSRHSLVNAAWEGNAIRHFASIDIGLAVDRGNGLITPVIRNCAAKGIADIDQELSMLIEKAENNKLKPEEYTNATFTISNLGSFGVDEFTAIINPPGSAILALGATRREAVVDDNNNITVEQRMKMTLSCDHRVIDGAAGARFLSDLRGIMEYPVKTLF